MLQAEHLIGRGPQCALRLEQGYVSAQHAVIRWSGSAWQLLDRGSRNGTTLAGRRVEPGHPHNLAENSLISFGHPSECWRLHSASEPQVMVTCLRSGSSITADNGIISLPSAQDPRCMLYQGADGAWKLERADRLRRVIDDGDEFELEGSIYRFTCPASLGTTFSPEASESQGCLQFRVSSDEEFVELAFHYPNRVVSLGCRGHNYLLLMLARANLGDASAGIPESNRGWMYKGQLAEALKTTPQQVDGEVFRIRAHVAQHKVPEAENIIERRPRTTQLRIGISRIEILQI
jgi:hypothetical protein